MLTDNNRGGRKVELKSVYTFFLEMSPCSEATKNGLAKIQQYVFSELEDNISVCFQLEYQIS